SCATIFNIFINKQNLMLEVVKWLYEKNYEHLEGIMKSDNSFLERISQLFSISNRIFDLNLEINRDVNASDPDEMGRILSLYKEKTRQLYSDFFWEGKRDGCIHPDLSTESLLLYLDAFFALMQVRPEVSTEFKYDKRLFKEYMSILWFGMIKNERSEFMDCL
ncbi:hypothetical protein ACFLWU_07000, partial [Chloroflexota bacterium]